MGTQAKVGDHGRVMAGKIVQVLSDTEALVRIYDTLVQIEGLDFSKSVNDQQMPPVYCIVAGTHSYKTVGGSTNTIFLLKPWKPVKAPSPLVLATDFPNLPFIRTWTSEPHGSKIRASFVGYAKAEVSLMGTNGKVITVPLASLCDEDKQYVRKMIADEKQFIDSERRRLKEKRRYDTTN